MTTYIGLAISDTMFEGAVTIHRTPLTVEEVRTALTSAVSCVNPSHQATLHALRSRCHLDIPIPPAAPRIALRHGDRFIVIAARGLPRLEGRHQYTPDEIARATFTFAEWHVET